ncbi:TspO/MBR family protein [Ferrovibrio sp.]|uniref:TspO/MBR family protein n=1 Tax=Ferrovibrio sp. TaxID=1917215 RepID=UPI001B532383|nr:TspO/MBR family protein [Ferrovibrio sp.]MBP7065778.1 tryptophan-rich sensory protein [Ferrovibrio sp.]
MTDLSNTMAARPPAQSRPLLSLAMLGLSFAACFGIAGLGAWVTREPVRGWYQSLAKPAGLTPPDIAFPIIWNLLFAMMALAAWLAWRRWQRLETRGWGIWLLFGLQLGLNLLWSVLFFGLQQPAWALAEIGLLWLAILACQRGFAGLDRRAGWLLLPYLAWVGYAALLNGLIVWLNRG